MTRYFSPGSLVRARGREWIVLPSDDEQLLRLRPLTGADVDEVGVFMPLESGGVSQASFEPPNPGRVGDAAGVTTLFDAARLSLRAGAAPFRSIGRISVVPRPYQFVPVVMALRQDPVRLLIADDVGVGKTIEAGLVARELLDRGLARRLCVLCPAHLCDQWERELSEKFVLDTVVVQPSRYARLERDLPRHDISVYEYYPHLIASIDFVKRTPHKDALLRAAPDLLIVDEAHIAARPRGDRGQSEHQRHELLRALAADPDRHVILVTATPHSGIEESFRSLLGLLDPDFDPPGAGRVSNERLLPHIVQRRRADVEHWIGSDTPFPDRVAGEIRYSLSAEYRALFERVLDYCRETIAAGDGLGAAQQRVRHWAAIALLRCVLSSPASAIAVLSARSDRLATEDEADGPTAEQVDNAYRPQVLDVSDEESAADYAPTAPFEDEAADWSTAERARLARFLRDARQLVGPERDRKLKALIEAVDEIAGEGYHPIVFCRFIQTARYVAEELFRALESRHRGLTVTAITGELADEIRRERVAELATHGRRVLVATDCLSEGINLQDHFDAVLHYDLPWNPNRIEQREGRVDRFGQPRDIVRTLLLYGANNEVDQVVLDVLLRKARAIRDRLGISVPVPAGAEEVLQTVVDTVLLRQARSAEQFELALSTPGVSRLHDEWDARADSERESIGYFAQHGIAPDEVEREVRTTDAVLGSADDVVRFLADALARFNGGLNHDGDSPVYAVSPGDLTNTLAPLLGGGTSPFAVTTDRQLDQKAVYVGRTHPAVAAVCDAVLDRAFRATPNDTLARAGAMFTGAVTTRTVLLLLRLRYLFREGVEEYAEEVMLVGFTRGAAGPAWLEPLADAAHGLARTRPSVNMPTGERSRQVAWALDYLRDSDGWFAPLVNWRKGELATAHTRLRALTGDASVEIHAYEPPASSAASFLCRAGSAANGLGDDRQRRRPVLHRPARPSRR